MYDKSYHNEHKSFCHKMCNVVNTRFFMTISHFNENNDLGSSKALKWVLIKSSFFSKGLFFTIIMLFVLKSSKQDFVFGRTDYGRCRQCTGNNVDNADNTDDTDINDNSDNTNT